VIQTAGGYGYSGKRQAQLTERPSILLKANRQPGGRHFDVTWQACGWKLLAEAKSIEADHQRSAALSLHSETGMNRRNQAANPLGFRLWIYTTPGPRNRHTNPSPEVKLATHPEAARSML